jgi:hypothetical protein
VNALMGEKGPSLYAAFFFDAAEDRVSNLILATPARPSFANASPNNKLQSPIFVRWRRRWRPAAITVMLCKRRKKKQEKESGTP